MEAVSLSIDPVNVLLGAHDSLNRTLYEIRCLILVIRPNSRIQISVIESNTTPKYIRMTKELVVCVMSSVRNV